MNLDHRPGIQVRDGEISEIADAIVIEDRFRILFNDCPVTDMIASRDQLLGPRRRLCHNGRTYPMRRQGET